jgi:hypothetical protein
MGRGWIVCALVWLLPVVARAQSEAAAPARGGQGSVSGTGMQSLSRQPDKLRMIVELLGKGKTLEEALGKLKDRREAALLTLESLKAAKDSIIVGEPGQSVVQANQLRQMEQMVRQRMMMARGHRSSKPPQLPVSVTASAILIADWPLTGDTVEKRLLAAGAIEEKIKAADLAGAKEMAKLSPEEEEMREDAESMGNFGQEQVAPGTPQFVYVARISADERDQAMAQAFAKAKAHAARLAKAAGVRLGALVSVNDGPTFPGQEGEFFPHRSYGPFGNDPAEIYLQQLLGGNRLPALRDKENETMDPEAANLQFTFHLMATFSTQP